MTSPEGDKDIDDYLHRGSEESRRYRALRQEEPPADLDRAVLTQARAAVASVPSQVPYTRSRKRTQWMVPFALAASVLLTFAIFREGGDETGVRFEAPVGTSSAPMTTEVPEEREVSAAEATRDSVADDASVPVTEEKSTVPIERSLRASAPPQAVGESSAARDEASTLASGAAASAPVDVSAEAPVPPPTVPPLAPPSAPSVATFSGSRVTVPAESQAQSARRAAAESAQVESTAARSAVALQDAARAQEPVRTPEVWLEDIRTLRAASNTAEADAELLLFMVAYPDYFRQNPGVVRP